MSDAPDSPPPARRPVIVPPAPLRKAGAAPASLPSAAPLVKSAGNAPPPVPGSIMRSLLGTRVWAVIAALGMLLIGVVLTARAKTAWDQLDDWESLPLEEFGTAARLLNRGDVIVQFAIAVACLYAAPRLFRYAGAIARLRDARRMAELENALRHQRAVWTVFGTAGALWLLSCIGQVYFLVTSLEELEAMEDARTEFEMAE